MFLLKRLKYFKGLLAPIGFFVALLFTGTIGYMTLEGFSFLDSLYMTVITISTVGYMEVAPLSAAGRIFTIFIILINIGAFTYFIAFLTRYLLDGEFMHQYKQLKMITLFNILIIM
jgi:voltage-gated potassium channel